MKAIKVALTVFGVFVILGNIGSGMKARDEESARAMAELKRTAPEAYNLLVKKIDSGASDREINEWIINK